MENNWFTTALIFFITTQALLIWNIILVCEKLCYKRKETTLTAQMCYYQRKYDQLQDNIKAKEEQE